MNKILTLLTLAATALTTGCNTASDPVAQTDDLRGSVRITAQVSSDVTTRTRAETANLPAEVIPDPYTFPLHITGTYTDDAGQEQSYDQSWETVNGYDSPLMIRGNYTASVTSGDGSQEGPDAAWFAGTADFTILSRQTITTDITVTLQNAAVQLAFDDWFTQYYSEATFTLRTESDNRFTSTLTQQPLVFIKPATKLYLSGSAVKSQNGATVEFPETEIGTTVARSLHTVRVQASQVGSSGLSIQLDDTFTELEETAVELNPEA